jgi:DNA-binding transcriptional regulator GbsR (MarR family)
MNGVAGPAPGSEAASEPGAARPARAVVAGHAAPVLPRDDAAVRRFIEDFAQALTEMGVPRMPARVFVALVTSDSGRLTAAELAATLGASPAAMSGAVRYLVQLGLIRREGEPGSRRHYYRVPDDVWGEIISIRNRAMARWTAVLREGIPVLGADTPAGLRIADSVRFFEFVSAELPLVIDRWQDRKAALDGRPGPAR